MSHFTTLVLLKSLGEDVEAQVGEILAPYDENIEVEEYERDCHCIGQVARNEAERIASEKYGTLRELRDSFWKDKTTRERESDEQQDEAWKEHIKDYIEMGDSIFDSHPMKNKPDPTCGFYVGEFWESQVREGKLDEYKLGQRYEDGSGCGGTGKHMTTYNPQSKWDWWSIGGRWQGDLDPNYERIKDPRNYEACSYCDGTGDRPDLSPPEWKEQCHGCNVCHGTGKALKYILAPHMAGNIKPVREIPDYVPHAIITPDGRWHESGKMGWWAIVTDEQENWPVIAKRILQENEDCIAVLCDLHI